MNHLLSPQDKKKLSQELWREPSNDDKWSFVAIFRVIFALSMLLLTMVWAAYTFYQLDAFFGIMYAVFESWLAYQSLYPNSTVRKQIAEQSLRHDEKIALNSLTFLEAPCQTH